MTSSTHSFADLEARVVARQSLSDADAASLMTSTDLIAIGVLGETARKVRHADRVTYSRVCGIRSGTLPPDRGEAGEVRLSVRPGSADEALKLVAAAARLAAGVPFTGFSLGDLLDLVQSDHLALAELAGALRQAGLDAVAEAPVDRLGGRENAVEVIRAAEHGGLGVWRLTIEQASGTERLGLLLDAAAIQRELHSLHAFAPLPTRDPVDMPSTGYDDVRTVAVARLICGDISSIQVDWQLYGPKLAQVAIAYGADDIDNVSAVDHLGLGHRRAPREDIERQIRAAFAVPAERDGRFALRS